MKTIPCDAPQPDYVHIFFWCGMDALVPVEGWHEVGDVLAVPPGGYRIDYVKILDKGYEVHDDVTMYGSTAIDKYGTVFDIYGDGEMIALRGEEKYMLKRCS